MKNVFFSLHQSKNKRNPLEKSPLNSLRSSFDLSRDCKMAPGSRVLRAKFQSYALLRNSFSGKWGSFVGQQRPLALSSLRRLHRPPSNVVVRHQDGLSARSALPSAPAMHLRRPSLHLPRLQHELLWHEGAGARPSTWSSKTHSSRAACPSS